jgi:hypothetical protein
LQKQTNLKNEQSFKDKCQKADKAFKTLRRQNCAAQVLHDSIFLRAGDVTEKGLQILTILQQMVI